MSKIRKISILLLKIIRITLLIMGGLFLVVFVLALTSLPYWARYKLARTASGLYDNTQTIVVMGAGGFPSESTLMRMWYTAELANEFTQAKLVVTTPGTFADSSSTVFHMYQYLIESGIDSCRILIEDEGLNTRHQALMVHEMFEKGLFKEPIVIVSSPAHIYRSVKCFQKVGFTSVGGKPATEMALETDLRINEKLLGGNDFISVANNSISLRYKFWDYLKYEVEVLREYIAISYYKLKGWI